VEERGFQPLGRLGENRSSTSEIYSQCRKKSAAGENQGGQLRSKNLSLSKEKSQGWAGNWVKDRNFPANQKNRDTYAKGN